MLGKRGHVACETACMKAPADASGTLPCREHDGWNTRYNAAHPPSPDVCALWCDACYAVASVVTCAVGAVRGCLALCGPAGFAPVLAEAGAAGAGAPTLLAHLPLPPVLADVAATALLALVLLPPVHASRPRRLRRMCWCLRRRRLRQRCLRLPRRRPCRRTPCTCNGDARARRSWRRRCRRANSPCTRSGSARARTAASPCAPPLLPALR